MIKIVKDSSVQLDLDSYDIELDKEYTVKELIDVIINHGVCESGVIEIHYGPALSTECVFSQGIITSDIRILEPCIGMIVECASLKIYGRSGSRIYRIDTSYES